MNTDYSVDTIIKISKMKEEISITEQLLSVKTLSAIGEKKSLIKKITVVELQKAGNC